MDIILLERVERLGQMGDVVTVKDGFARNFLLPQKKALRATDDNKKVFEAGRTQIEAENLKRREEAEGVAATMDGANCVLLRQAGETGQLYGSVSSRDIAEALADAGFTVTRNQIILNRAIKTLGIHDVDVRLHPEVKVSVGINIARSAEEAEAQVTGADAIAGQEVFETEELAAAAAADLSDAPEDAADEETAAEDAPADEAEAKDAAE